MSSVTFTEQEIRERVGGIVGQALDLAPEKILPDANLYREYGLDSLGAIYIFVELNLAFEIPEPEAEADFIRLSTVEKIVDFVLHSLGRSPRTETA
jgi:acyl carrier protein